MIEDNGEVLKMRAIGTRYKIIRESLNSPVRIDGLSDSKMGDDFSESIRLLQQASGYLYNWVDWNASLSSVESFKNVVMPELQSFNMSVEFISDAYKKEFDRAAYLYPELNELKASLYDLEVLCPLGSNANQLKED